MADAIVIHDAADEIITNSDKRLESKMEEMEKKNQELTKENLKMREKLRRLFGEIEEMKGVDEDKKKRFGEMEKVIEQMNGIYDNIESLSMIVVDLETEVMNRHKVLNILLIGVDKSVEEVTELKKVLMEKSDKLEMCEKEGEGLKKERDEVEKKIRVLEREIRVLEENCKKIRLDEVIRERLDDKEIEINELVKKVDFLKLELMKNGEDLAKSNSEKKFTEEALSEAERRVKDMEFKKEVLVKKVEEAKKMIGVLSERSLKGVNGVRAQKGLVVVAAGLVAVTLFVCYCKVR